MTDIFPRGDLFSLIVVPALIFFARIADVTFGTLRTIWIKARLPPRMKKGFVLSRLEVRLKG